MRNKRDRDVPGGKTDIPNFAPGQETAPKPSARRNNNERQTLPSIHPAPSKSKADTESYPSTVSYCFTKDLEPKLLLSKNGWWLWLLWWSWCGRCADDVSLATSHHVHAPNQGDRTSQRPCGGSAKIRLKTAINPSRRHKQRNKFAVSARLDRGRAQTGMSTTLSWNCTPRESTTGTSTILSTYCNWGICVVF